MTPDDERELLDRVRRTETKITDTMVQLGLRNNAEKATFNEGRLTLLSPHTSLRELLDRVPRRWTEPVEIYIGDDWVATIDMQEPAPPPLVPQ